MSAFGQHACCRFPDALVAKLGVLRVLGLVQTVGKEENGGSGVYEKLLLREVEVGKDTDGQISVARHQAHAVADQQRSVVAGVAVGEQSAWKVQHADEERDKHVGVIAFGLRVVQGLHNVGWPGSVGGHVAEQRPCDRHVERGGDTFARHVADAEEQFLVADVKVEQIAADALCRGQ